MNGSEDTPVTPKASCVLAFADDSKPSKIIAIIEAAQSTMAENASLWLWKRGTYDYGSVSSSSWDIAVALRKSGWIIRNEIVWACRTGDPAPENRLQRSYERMFHLVRSMDYYYDRTMGGAVSQFDHDRDENGITATRSGVVGARYVKKINASPFLSDAEKENAKQALFATIVYMQNGTISDFRMIIRGEHKATRSVATKIDRDGYYIRVTKAHNRLLGDLWTAFLSKTNSEIPERMLESLLLLSSPSGINGVVLDLFPSQDNEKTVTRTGRLYVPVSAMFGITTVETEQESIAEVETSNEDKIQQVSESGQ